MERFKQMGSKQVDLYPLDDKGNAVIDLNTVIAILQFGGQIEHVTLANNRSFEIPSGATVVFVGKLKRDS